MNLEQPPFNLPRQRQARLMLRATCFWVHAVAQTMAGSLSSCLACDVPSAWSTHSVLAAATRTSLLHFPRSSSVWL